MPVTLLAREKRIRRGFAGSRDARTIDDRKPGDLRLTLRRVLEALATYPDRAELKREYPEREDEDTRQALAFAPS